MSREWAAVYSAMLIKPKYKRLSPMGRGGEGQRGQGEGSPRTIQPVPPKGSEQRWTAYHEAGHAVVGVALQVPIDGVSVRASSCYAGIALLRPAPVDTSVIDVDAPTPIFMPPKLRRALETRLWVSLAGDLAADLAVPHCGYGEPDTADQEAAETIAVRLTGRSKDALERAEAMTAAELRTDWDTSVAMGDLLAWHEAVQYINFAQASTRRLLAEWWPAVEAVAEALLKTPVLSGRQVKRIIRKPNKETPDAT